MKKNGIILMAVIWLLGLSGCASGAKEEKAGFQPMLKEDTYGTVSVAGNYSNFEALEAEFDRFNEFYPNIELSYTKLDDYNNTIGVALEGEDAPDIYFLMPWMIGNETYEPLFENAEDLVAPELRMELSCIRTPLLYRDEDGKVPMVPVFSTTYGMLVNEDLFQKAGIKVPTGYDEFLKACDSLKAAGYDTPVLGYNSVDSLFFHFAYTRFCGDVAKDEDAVERLNALDPSAGEYMRSSLEMIADMTDHGCINLETCGELENNYGAMILRFFEGDIPMMICSGDVVSGTQKRESQSEAFSADPFTYRFYVTPTTNEGGYFVNSASIEFSVNRNSKNLDAANEFMRFLVSSEELNEMARVKRMVTPSVDLSFDGVYAALGEVDRSHVIYTQEMGMLDATTIQFRVAAYLVGNGEKSVDEAVAGYGSYTQ